MESSLILLGRFPHLGRHCTRTPVGYKRTWAKINLAKIFRTGTWQIWQKFSLVKISRYTVCFQDHSDIPVCLRYSAGFSTRRIDGIALLFSSWSKKYSLSLSWRAKIFRSRSIAGKCPVVRVHSKTNVLLIRETLFTCHHCLSQKMRSFAVSSGLYCTYIELICTCMKTIKVRNVVRLM